jgi:hypothetical protein
MATAQITLIGGPTALIEVAGHRLLTDPTFDPPGDYELSYARLTKTGRPAVDGDQIGPIDAVVLSHEQHFDNLDRAGRAFLQRAARVLTTVTGAARLGSNAEGLGPWTTTTLRKSGRDMLHITATGSPRTCRHRTVVWRSHGFLDYRRQLEDSTAVHYRRYRLVRWDCGGRPPVRSQPGDAICRCRPHARSLASDHGYKRCHRSRTRFPMQ